MSNDTLGELARNAEYRRAALQPVVDQLEQIYGEMCHLSKLLGQIAVEARKAREKWEPHGPNE